MSFAQQLKFKANVNLIKTKLTKAVSGTVKKAETKRRKLEDGEEVKLDCFEKAKERLSIYQRQEEIDKKTLRNVAESFTNNIEYQRRMKQRIITDDYSQQYQEEPKQDPRILYMKRCLESLQLNLPILDKVYRKTLCLQDYHLSDGNCQGLADACQYLDTRIVNKMLFNNCGLTGDTLAVILEGI